VEGGDSCGNSTCLKTPQSGFLEEAEAVPAESIRPDRSRTVAIAHVLVNKMHLLRSLSILCHKQQFYKVERVTTISISIKKSKIKKMTPGISGCHLALIRSCYSSSDGSGLSVSVSMLYLPLLD